MEPKVGLIFKIRMKISNFEDLDLELDFQFHLCVKLELTQF
jgi:hypothetical protein